LNILDGIILPGGESTTIGKLLVDFEILEPLRDKILSGFPVWGTCAGMILLAKDIGNDERRHLSVMDISVSRNAYGPQIDSFMTSERIGCLGEEPFPLIFIRAPIIEKMGESVEVLATHKDAVIACRQGNMLATSFHPELTDDVRFHQFFVESFVRAQGVTANGDTPAVSDSSAKEYS
jgi:pyridoxal 5'-phosphate synthase pdxT subunit